MDIDIDRLRDRLRDEYGTGAFAGGFPAMLTQADDVKKMSDAEVVKAAEKAGILPWNR